MNLTALYDNLRAVLLAQLEPGVNVIRVNSPVLVGTTAGPAVTLTHIGGHPYGRARRLTAWRADDDEAVLTEAQIWEVTIQVGAIAQEPVGNTPGPTARDYVMDAARILQNDAGLAALKGRGLAPLKITDVRSFQIKNQKEAYEDVPSFDIVLIYRHVSESIAPVVDRFQPNIG